MSSKDKKDARPPEETLRAIEAQEAADEIARIKAMTEEDVEAELRKNGFDVDEIDRRTLANVKKLEAKEKRDAWRPKALERLRKAEEVMARPGIAKTRGLTREELLARIDAARKDPRMGGEIAVAYRDMKLEEASIERLEAILTAMEDIARMAEEID